ncbi:MAG: tetratricopeptide repeat protein [Myxococcales bacterium]|nr:tetratricopeptide repeat protein [Myxococcales bacterium]
MFSRYFQPYGIKRRLPVADRVWLDEPRQLRYVEIAVRLGAVLARAERIALLVEKAGIDMGAGRTDSAMAALDEARAAAETPQGRREIDYQRGRACLRARRNGDAEVLFRQTLAGTQLPDDLGRRALLQLGRTHISQGRYSDAIASLRQGLEGGGHTRQNHVGGHYDLVYALVHEGLNSEADAVLDAAESALDTSETLAHARLAYYRAWVAFARRDIDAAGTLVDDARREFVVHREFESVGCADLLRACIDFERADLTAAAWRCDAMLQSTAVLRADLLLAVLLLHGLTLFVIGRFAEAKAEYRRAARLGETQELPLLQARALEWLGDAHGFCGEWEHARTALAQCMAVRRSVGDRLGEAMALASLGNVERQTGGMAAAAAYYDEARTLATAIGSRWEVARIDGEQMEACFLAGDTRGAERYAAEAMAAYEALGDSLRLARVVKHMGQIAAVRDDFDIAEDCFQRAIDLVNFDANRIVRAELLDSRAESRADAGRVDDALRDLAAAQALAEPTGSVHLLNHISAHAAQIRERHAAQNVLNRYMEPKIVSRLLARGPRRLAENVEQDATILFSDIRGFTHLTESLGPHEVVALLNEHFEAMTDEIVQRGGTIDKFIGDAVMAVFGDPGRPRDDDAQRAVQAAVAMVRRRTRLNLTRKVVGLAWIDIGVGVNTGTVVMGNIGSARRMNYTVIGDAVNVAARLEALTKVHGHPVLISAETRGRLTHDWRTIPLGHIEVKGRAGKVDMYAVPCDGDDAL